MDTSMKNNNLLVNAYSAENFRKDAQQIIELIADELEDLQTNTDKKQSTENRRRSSLPFGKMNLFLKILAAYPSFHKKSCSTPFTFTAKDIWDIK